MSLTGDQVGVHSALANKIVFNALQQKLIPEVGDYDSVQPEFTFGADRKSRVDFLLTRPPRGDRPPALVYLEVKSVTLSEQHRDKPDVTIALFPDTVSERAQKHVKELMNVVEEGHEAICLFVIQRGDCTHFAPSFEKDCEYAKLILQASAKGVKMIAIKCPMIVTKEQSTEAAIHYNGSAVVDLIYKQHLIQTASDSSRKRRQRTTDKKT
ncbi:hypothetical protein CEUSTIGMA_g13587.t1 [Chlamydomonas eustigma]|uniref:Sugar fermentation stimulation protein C-terminal domain-containing protein n=1 Tax=Chlamydomonas eustigma TaxID=1157962 RepID=A0A250XFZ6_9CHLO|nr:hypothetical protein CEUSTIGMA_g9433.t1 [Chlamydomonas eustigma]GAX86174.1 hypothetical protein CEUSTIGMA_g13587.t1 [Chlamydomonas eustigma]|eukprot:GAX82005.1 hypothetical protein CEUSTIGMA_g9433.t1 [Chlamydomonas eustigma]